MNVPRGNLCSLSIRPSKSYLTRKVDTFSENDAYVIFQLGNQKEKTSTKVDQRTPSWDEEYTINPEGDNVMQVIVMDEDEVTDDEVGRGSINLTPFMQEGQPNKQWVSIKYGKKPAGKVLLEMTPCIGTGNSNQTHHYQTNKKIPKQVGAEDMMEQIFKNNVPPQQNQPYPNQQSVSYNYHQSPQSQTRQQPQHVISNFMGVNRQENPYNSRSHYIVPQHISPQQPQFQSHYVPQQQVSFSQQPRPQISQTYVSGYQPQRRYEGQQWR